MRRAATLLLTAARTTGGLAALAPPAPADIVARRLTTTVTNLAPEHRTCRLDADLYVPAGELSHRVISPSRVADVTTPVTIELPAIVHQFPAATGWWWSWPASSPTGARLCRSRSPSSPDPDGTSS